MEKEITPEFWAGLTPKDKLNQFIAPIIRNGKDGQPLTHAQFDPKYQGETHPNNSLSALVSMITTYDRDGSAQRDMDARLFDSISKGEDAFVQLQAACDEVVRKDPEKRALTNQVIHNFVTRLENFINDPKLNLHPVKSIQVETSAPAPETSKTPKEECADLVAKIEGLLLQMKEIDDDYKLDKAIQKTIDDFRSNAYNLDFPQIKYTLQQAADSLRAKIRDEEIKIDFRNNVTQIAATLQEKRQSGENNDDFLNRLSVEYQLTGYDKTNLGRIIGGTRVPDDGAGIPSVKRLHEVIVAPQPTPETPPPLAEVVEPEAEGQEENSEINKLNKEIDELLAVAEKSGKEITQLNDLSNIDRAEMNLESLSDLRDQILDTIAENFSADFPKETDWVAAVKELLGYGERINIKKANVLSVAKALFFKENSDINFIQTVVLGLTGNDTLTQHIMAKLGMGEEAETEVEEPLAENPAEALRAQARKIIIENEELLAKLGIINLSRNTIKDLDAIEGLAPDEKQLLANGHGLVIGADQMQINRLTAVQAKLQKLVDKLEKLEGEETAALEPEQPAAQAADTTETTELAAKTDEEAPVEGGTPEAEVNAEDVKINDMKAAALDGDYALSFDYVIKDGKWKKPLTHITHTTDLKGNLRLFEAFINDSNEKAKRSNGSELNRKEISGFLNTLLMGGYRRLVYDYMKKHTRENHRKPTFWE